MDNSSHIRETLMGSSSSSAPPIDGVLDIILHHARNIHNICIYGKQDVYAKFYITHTQDAIYSTQPVRAGGRNPEFNQNLQVMISKVDAVLKCEIWMMSCVRTYLQDQLLGFVLVPLCDLLGKGRVTKDYSLSSTELFHTPAGIVCLSLTFYLRGTDIPLYTTILSSASCVGTQNDLHNVEVDSTHTMKGNEAARAVAADNFDDDMVMNGNNQGMTLIEYNSIEFPDLNDACENHELVSAYLSMASGTDAKTDEDAYGKAHHSDQLRMHTIEGGLSGAPFLQLGLELGESKGNDVRLDDGSWSSSHNCALQGDVDAVLLTDMPHSSQAQEVQLMDSASTSCVEASTRSSNSQAILSPTHTISTDGHSFPLNVSNSYGQESQSSFGAPLVTVSLEPEKPLMQQQIADMYMKSMQQFSESLGKMKLPFDLENAHSQQVELCNEPRDKKEEPVMEPTSRDGHRLFYGSRAFF